MIPEAKTGRNCRCPRSAGKCSAAWITPVKSFRASFRSALYCFRTSRYPGPCSRKRTDSHSRTSSFPHCDRQSSQNASRSSFCLVRSSFFTTRGFRSYAVRISSHVHAPKRLFDSARFNWEKERRTVGSEPRSAPAKPERTPRSSSVRPDRTNEPPRCPRLAYFSLIDANRRPYTLYLRKYEIACSNSFFSIAPHQTNVFTFPFHIYFITVTYFAFWGRIKWKMARPGTVS